jgi:ribonuclease HI
MHGYFTEYRDIVAYTDGSSLKNPGRAGCGVAFLGRPRDTEALKMAIDDLEVSYQRRGGRLKGEEREFFFGVSLNLGIASNNYAEYTGLILAQLVFSMFKQKEVAIMTDSQLVVNQVKGIAKTRNFRLVELIKIVHTLAFQFRSMGLDYIERTNNTIADSLAKEASELMGIGGVQSYKFYFRLESLMKTIKRGTY